MNGCGFWQVSKIRHCTCTHRTHDPKTVGLPAPMQNTKYIAKYEKRTASMEPVPERPTTGVMSFGLVLGKFGFKPIQTRFEPKPNQQFQFRFGDSCHETKLFGFGLGNQ